MMILTDQPVRVSEVLVIADAKSIQTGLGSISTGPDLEEAPTVAETELPDDGSSAPNVFNRPRVVFNWTDPKTSKKFARLEAKLLAQKADNDEKQTYQQMHASRRLNFDARIYLQRYGETERMKMLSQKLKEIQHFLKPITMA
jgi:hypothetical protein